ISLVFYQVRTVPDSLSTLTSVTRIPCFGQLTYSGGVPNLGKAMSCLGRIRRTLGTWLVLVSACACLASASSATLLLEEPYGKMGFVTATGHAAVYLSGVCAETPRGLRPCARGELGAVISRYDGVGGYDWVAIPLIPYLYACERPDDIPLFADARRVAFLRDQYR